MMAQIAALDHQFYPINIGPAQSGALGNARTLCHLPSTVRNPTRGVGSRFALHHVVQGSLRRI